MKTFRLALTAALQNTFSPAEVDTMGRLLLEKITGHSRAELFVNKEITLNESQRELAEQYTERLKNHEPIQYILGETEFYGLKFNVNASVLIPRPETEELVEWVSDDWRQAADAPSGEILDIGTGSGCIAIALKKKNPRAAVSAMDISAAALRVAAANARMNEVAVEFIQDDVCNPATADRVWDVMVSNPPYIPLAERQTMAHTVTGFEPHGALFVPDNDPLIFYRKITEFARKHLKTSGKLYVETHRDAAEACKRLFEEAGFVQVEVRRDISGNERMVRALHPLRHFNAE